jgi:acetyl esterase/lipase
MRFPSRCVAVWAAALAVLLVHSGVDPALGQDAKTPAKQPSSAAIEKDIPYTDGSDQQKLDLFLPKQKDFTTFVFTYGGGWHTGSRKSVTPIGVKLQSFGFGCALLSHRVGTGTKFADQIEDVAAGFAWVRKHIAAKGGDPKRVFLMGHSSGAQLSLLLATDPQYLARHKLTPADVAGAIGLSTPVDLEPRKDGKGFGNTLIAGRGADVFSRDLGILKNVSPIQHLANALPPVLLVVGERDFPMLESDARSYVEKAKKVGMTATVFVAKGRNHMGVVQALLNDKDPVLEQIVAFVKMK